MPPRTYLREAEVTYRRVAKLPEQARGRVTSSRAVAPVLRELIGSRMAESFVVLALSTKHEIIGYHEVSRGGISSCPVSPADVFRYPIAAGSVAILIAHNHPSGDPEPSPEDIAMTRKLREAGDIVGIQILDHIIVTDDRYYSFLDAGVL